MAKWKSLNGILVPLNNAAKASRKAHEAVKAGLFAAEELIGEAKDLYEKAHGIIKKTIKDVKEAKEIVQPETKKKESKKKKDK